MNDKTVYIVVCYWGVYDDYTEEIQHVFTNKKDAEQYIAKQNKTYVKYRIDEAPMDGVK